MTEPQATLALPGETASPIPAARKPAGIGRVVVGLVFLAGYVLPLFKPPPGQPQFEPSWDASLLDRLFPTVPGWWVVARLLSLLIGAAVIASAARGSVPIRLPRLSRTVAQPGRGVVVAALVVALAHALLSLWVAGLDRSQQLGYFALLGVPTALLWVGARWSPRQILARHGTPRRRRVGLAVALVLAIWCAWRIPAALHSPRAATPIDLWLNFQWLIETARSGRNFLTSSSQPGVPDSYMLFVGGPLLASGGIRPSLTWVQAFHTVWLLGTAVGIALLAARTMGRAAAPVAVTAFLFSPVILMTHVAPAPFGLLTLLVVALLLLVWRIYMRPSLTTMAALGAVGGFAATFPHLTHWALAACLAGAVRALRKPRLPRIGVAIGLATFVAATVPSLPGLDTLNDMALEYLRWNWQWAGSEAVLLGQRSPRREPDMLALRSQGRGQPYDVLVGGLLMPFAVPRTGMRMCGDVLFEPITAALAAVGVVVCLRRPGDRGAAALLVVAALALLPAATSTTSDRISMTRGIGTPVAMGLLAAAGFSALRRTLANRRRAVPLAAATIAASMVAGAVIFDVTTPRIIPASALDVMMRVILTLPDPTRAVILEQTEPFEPLGWLHEYDVATYLPASPIPSWRFTGPDSLDPSDPAMPAPELYFWSPGLEEDAKVSTFVCARWPAAALYVIEDRAGLSWSFAASPSGPHPADPDVRWFLSDCSSAGKLLSRF